MCPIRKNPCHAGSSGAAMPIPMPSVSPICSQTCGIPRQTDGSDRMAATGGVADVQFQPDSTGAVILPLGERRVQRMCQRGVTRPDSINPFFVDNHVKGFAQTIKMVRRASPLEVPEIHLGVGARYPVPIERGEVGAFSCPRRPVIVENKGHARRRHQTFLASGEGDVDAPLVHLHHIAGQRRHAVCL